MAAAQLPNPRGKPPEPKPDRPNPVLRLPHLSEEGQPGSRFVRSVVGITLWSMGILLGASLLIACVVRMDVTVKTAGTLEPVRVWPVRAREGGAILEVLVQTGDTIKKGEPVLRLDPLEISSTIAGLRAQRRSAEVEGRRSTSADPLQQREQNERVAQARARLVTARASLRQKMVDFGLGINSDSLLARYREGQHVAVDLAVAEVRSAEAELRLAGAQGDALGLTRFEREKTAAEVERIDAQLQNLEARVKRLEVPAPTTGVVMTEQIEKLAGSVVTPGQLLLEVAELGEWRINLAVSQRDVQRIKVGDSVKVEVQAWDASDREQLRGNVTYVSPEPLAAQLTGPPATPGGGGMYRVVAELDRQQLASLGLEKLRRGYTVQGSVITRSGLIITLLWNYLTDRFKK